MALINTRRILRRLPGPVLAYYAVHGTLPRGVTSVPAAARPVYACSGSPS